MFCPFCRYPIDRNTNFCPNCGNSVPPSPSSPIKEGPTEKDIQCLACNGTGFWRIPPNRYKTRHESCGGTGILTVPINARIIKCKGCDGTGLIRVPPNMYPSIHDACQGTGLIIIV
jgi:hypothetical protein